MAAIELDFAAIALRQPAKNPRERRFTRAVAADERMNFAALQVEVEIRKDGYVVAFLQAGDLQQRSVSHTPPLFRNKVHRRRLIRRRCLAFEDFQRGFDAEYSQLIAVLIRRRNHCAFFNQRTNRADVVETSDKNFA